MNICIPVEADLGLDSRVCAHFGSAPCFLIVDSATGECRATANGNQHHGHGRCLPLASLQGENIDAVVVGGIGRGALGKLMAANINVYCADDVTAKDALVALCAGSLPLVAPHMACAQHRHRGSNIVQ
jgi:predicted Fe-Mo cluster-binding NifX family protein